MGGFLYSLALKLLYPTSLCLLLIGCAALLRNRKVARCVCLILAAASLLVCGNGWVVGALGRQLERRHLPPEPIPDSDCILILSGGINSQIRPRSTIEVGEAGDRVLYGAHLFKQGAAPVIVCTGDAAIGATGMRPAADDMAVFLDMLGVPECAVLRETQSKNTSGHARHLGTLFEEREFKRVLLVTSAMHMPRSLAVFRRAHPGIEFVPAPTDFRFTDSVPRRWYQKLNPLIPTPRTLLEFSEVTHEYLGLAYYKLRGWI